MAFMDEIEKIGNARSPGSAFASHTVGAPRAKVTPIQAERAPTLSSSPSPKLVGPAAGYGQRQNYSQPNVAAPPPTNTTHGEEAREAQPPNVVYGVR